MVSGRKDPEKRRAADERYREANREKIRERQRPFQATYGMRHKHGMRPEDWATLWDAQQGLCYLCAKELVGKVVIDHDHDHCPPGASCPTCRRGLTHHDCNTAIGMAGDDPARLRILADALETAQNAYQARKAATTTPVQALLFD